jgi:hypothetical protein
MRELGINNDTQVVAYDAHGGMFAARLWWLLRWVGHSDVAVLDGGMAAWQALGETLTSEVPAPAVPGNIQDLSSLVKTVDAQALLDNLKSNPQVVDARAGSFPWRERNHRCRRTYPGREEPLLQGQPASRWPFKSATQREEWLSVVGDPQAGHAVRLGRHRLPQPAGAGSGRLAGRASLSGFVERVEFRSAAPGGHGQLILPVRAAPYDKSGATLPPLPHRLAGGPRTSPRTAAPWPAHRVGAAGHFRMEIGILEGGKLTPADSEILAMLCGTTAMPKPH